MPNQEEVPTEPAMGAITDRQLLVDAVQKLGELKATVKDGFEASASRDLELVQRVTALESWKLSADERLNRNSDRADQPSKHDLEAQAALAAEVEERKALAKKVDEILVIGRELKTAAITFWKTPIGKAVYYVACGAVAGWLAKNNFHIPGINP